MSGDEQAPVGRRDGGAVGRTAVRDLISAHLPDYGPGVWAVEIIVGCSCGWARDMSGYGGQWAWHVTHALDSAGLLVAAAAPRAGADTAAPCRDADDQCVNEREAAAAWAEVPDHMKTGISLAGAVRALAAAAAPRADANEGAPK